MLAVLAVAATKPIEDGHEVKRSMVRKPYERLPRVGGRPLQRIRKRHFAKHPLCVMCFAVGRVTTAAQLDHIIPLELGGKDFDEDNGTNRQGLCIECHKEKSLKDFGMQKRKETGVDERGFPTDANHFWNGGGRGKS
jgi:5-methylcytosine-specific restriction protein A